MFKICNLSKEDRENWKRKNTTSLVPLGLYTRSTSSAVLSKTTQSSSIPGLYTRPALAVILPGSSQDSSHHSLYKPIYATRPAPKIDLDTLEATTLSIDDEEDKLSSLLFQPKIL